MVSGEVVIWGESEDPTCVLVELLLGPVQSAGKVGRLMGVDVAMPGSVPGAYPCPQRP